LPPDPIPAQTWPTRDPAAVHPILEATPKQVFAFKPVDGIDTSTLSDAERHRVDTPEFTVTYKGIHANSLLRLSDPSADDDRIPIIVNGQPEKISFSSAINSLILGFPPNARLMSSRTLDAAARHAALQAKLTPQKKTPVNLSVVPSGLP